MLVLKTSCCPFRYQCGTKGIISMMDRVQAPPPSAGCRSRGHRSLAAVQPDAACMPAQAGPSSITSAQQQQQQQQHRLIHQQQQQHQAAAVCDMSASDSDSDSGPLRVPLKLVVQDAVKRWFNETLSEARRGDVKQQALLAQMLAEGYGCKQDLDESRRWAERARLRGYQMSGVYCEL